jgi:hypothetical protein
MSAFLGRGLAAGGQRGARSARFDDGRRSVSDGRALIASNRSTRVDERRRITEEASFFGPGDGRIFGVTHLPLDDIIGAVLICSPIKLEAMKNYRREVLLARTLAEKGLAVQRFHYRGTGHSGGNSAMPTVRSLVDDAVWARELLLDRAGVTSTASIGTRLGGSVAAASGHPREPLVLWDPITHPPQYLGEVLRAVRIAKLRRPSEFGSIGPDLSVELRDRGSIDALGFRIDARFGESLQTFALSDALGAPPRPILLIDVSRRNELRPDLLALTGTLSRTGFDIESKVIRRADVGWWFMDLQSRTRELDEDLVSVTTEWLRREVALELRS